MDFPYSEGCHDATIDNLLEKIFEQLELSTHEKEQIVL
jgi:hypothetical protein